MNFIKKREELLNQYSKVFDEEGNIKICGRYQCSTLIELCTNFNSTQNINYGDINTGIMNEHNIKALIKSMS